VWVDIETGAKVPKVCYIPFKSDENNQKKCFDPVTASSFWVMHYKEVQKFVFTIWTSWVSKDAEFYVDFKNIKLP
jgi:hypothetical protein